MIFLLFIFFALILVRLYLVTDESRLLAGYYAAMILAGLAIPVDLGCAPAPVAEFSVGWFYFQTQLAFYFFTLVFARRPAMVVHRFIVVIVLAFAFVFKFETVAISLLRLHDVGDLLIYVPANFAVTAAVFAVTRLAIFPWFIFGRCIFEARTPAQWIGVGGLVAIQALHLYWARNINDHLK